MKIGVTDTGRGDKQINYYNWMKSIHPEVELVLLSYTKNNAAEIENCDGLLLTGGVDVDPKYSKAEPIEQVKTYDTFRDDFEFDVLTRAFQNEMPILGVCRGLQVVNVFLGGTLYADLQSSGFAKHDSNEQETDIRHSVTVVENTLLKKIVCTENGEINSHHHQAAKEIAPKLLASSYSEDNVVESLEWKNKNTNQFLCLVQWHPGRMNDVENPFAKNIGAVFLQTITAQKNN